jgi:hypothetical protein
MASVRARLIVLPGLLPKTPVNWLIPCRSYDTDQPARSVACSGSPRIFRRKPSWTLGRQAALTLGEKLFLSV